MVDKDGKKMSKSARATRSRWTTCCKDFGADVMPLVGRSLAYENDVKVDLEFFALAGESYRKVRNTLRFMLSNLVDFDPERPATAVPPMPVELGLDAWVLARVRPADRGGASAYDAYDFQTAPRRPSTTSATTRSARSTSPR